MVPSLGALLVVVRLFYPFLSFPVSSSCGFLSYRQAYHEAGHQHCERSEAEEFCCCWCASILSFLSSSRLIFCRSDREASPSSLVQAWLVYGGDRPGLYGSLYVPSLFKILFPLIAACSFFRAGAMSASHSQDSFYEEFYSLADAQAAYDRALADGTLGLPSLPPHGYTRDIVVQRTVLPAMPDLRECITPPASPPPMRTSSSANLASSDDPQPHRSPTIAFVPFPSESSRLWQRNGDPFYGPRPTSTLR